MTEKIMTVHLPKPGYPARAEYGAKVVTPNGEIVPNVSKVTISASADEFVECTIKCLVRVVQED